MLQLASAVRDQEDAHAPLALRATHSTSIAT